MTAPAAAGRVLATLNADGSRRWIRPKPAVGRYFRHRRAVAYGLMVLFLAIPLFRLRGKPLMLLDVPRREFTFFGTTFLPTDTLLLMLLGLSILIGIFLLTALFGRVWCGWACPQTVYMEYLFRPIERLVEGGWNRSRLLDEQRRHFHPRRLVTHAISVVLALVLAHTFLAYFVGTEALARWVRQSPYEHPVPFLVMAVTSALVLLDFAWFREQTCIVACPYGRWQSVLLDEQSLIIAYDPKRGEPRGHRPHRAEVPGLGDCVDCGACVLTCPTGIDIRSGLQMECIHCTQCADACDAVMAKLGKPPGLIRYTSREALAGRARRLLRPRTVLYPLAFLVCFGSFVAVLGTQPGADVTLLGAIGEPFTLEPDGSVVNQVRVKITNRARGERRYTVELLGAGPARVLAPELPLAVRSGRTATTSLFVILPPSAFRDHERDVRFRVSDGAGFTEEYRWRLRGPDAREEREEREKREERAK